MKITVKELIEKLKIYPDDDIVTFGNSDDALEFFQTKERGGICQIMFTTHLYRDEDGKLIVEEPPE